MAILTKLLTTEKAKSPIVEAYKILRTNLQYSFPDGQLQVILVTSGGPAEGKSTTCTNLAITMAESNLKVLLLETDLRKSVLHRYFHLPNLKGLTNILVENDDYKVIIQESGIENLDVITGGPKPPNPPELLGSQRMKRFLEELKESYDIILMDAPPVLPVTDAAVLSTHADGVVLVAIHGYTTFDELGETKARLEKVNARILGVVLNRVPISSRESYYYYYYDEAGDRHRSRRKKSGYSYGGKND
jgi:capsular exopolysaccharide synthesis family protein